MDDIPKLILTKPPLPEQIAIAAFLDRETARLDALIAKYRSMIDLLREKRQAMISRAVTKGLDRGVAMKDSGVAWLGEVPAGWDIAPVKSLFRVINGATPKSDVPDFWDGGVVWLTPADFPGDSALRISTSARTISTEGLNSCAATIVPTGSIVLSTRAPIGSLAFAEVPLAFNQGCRALVPSQALEIRYFLYALAVARVPLNLLGRGTTFLELSSDALAAFRVCAPTLPEQIAIATFLDRETAKIDTLIQSAEKAITLTQERRSALISAAVTGKINVLEAA